MPTSKNSFRLARDIEPIAYNLAFKPDLKKFTFEGSADIRVKADKPFSEITLHAVELKVLKAAAVTKQAIVPATATYNSKRETVTLKFKRRIRPADLEKLSLEFSGVLNDQMHGWYRTSYDVKGKKHWGAATQFEATDARRCFPCWDEPDFKATFAVTVTVPKHLTALSNMPVEQESLDRASGLKTIRYKPTPKMSTYLLAIVVAELECIEGKDVNGTQIRVWTTPGKKIQGQFALDVAKHTLPYFADWFGIPYQLPKCDMVALPDFAAGAMENWGLVTYRETALLVDPKNSSAAAQQRVAEVVDHELAHQWFGNLVTMDWWTDLWLNEGFASYVGPKAVDHQFPEWQMWNQYVSQEVVPVLKDDSLRSTHPIEIPVKDPYEIREIFDHVTYNKGSAVNRMLEHYLGEPVFQKGLRLYLKRFAYGNATTADLWAALEEVSGEPVRSIMASFTQQPGYPVLSIQEIPARSESPRERMLDLAQQRFIFDGQRDLSRLVWKLPVQINGPDLNKPSSFVMTSSRKRVSLSAGKNWLKANPAQSGFYRVVYSPGLFHELVGAAASGQLPPIDTLGFLDDTFALARAGQVQTSQVLELLSNCRQQTDYNFWLEASSVLAAVEEILDPSVHPAFFAFCRDLFTSVRSGLGWEKRPADGHLDHLLRSLVIGRLGHYADQDTLSQAQRRFGDFVLGEPLDPNLRGAVYSLIAEQGGPDQFKQLLQMYRKSPLQEEKMRLLRALTRFRDPKIIEEILKWSLTPEVRTQDTFVVLAGFGGNPHARTQNWRFVKAQFKTLTQHYKGGSVTLLGRILEGAAASFLTDRELRDAEQFFKKHPLAGTERTVKQTLEFIRANIRWAKRDCLDITAWLSR